MYQCLVIGFFFDIFPFSDGGQFRSEELHLIKLFIRLDAVQDHLLLCHRLNGIHLSADKKRLDKVTRIVPKKFRFFSVSTTPTCLYSHQFVALINCSTSRTESHDPSFGRGNRKYPKQPIRTILDFSLILHHLFANKDRLGHTCCPINFKNIIN